VASAAVADASVLAATSVAAAGAAKVALRQ